MKRLFLALLAVAMGAVVVQLIGGANAQREAGVAHAQQQAAHIRRLWARFEPYCAAHNGTAGLAPSHVRMHAYPHGVLPIADALRLPIGRVVPIILLRCQDGTQGYIRELPSGKALSYFDYGGKIQ